MNLSYWEIKTWLSNIDYTIIGSGIVGLSCALNLRQRFPKAKILVLEKGILPQGASTKNAGFACFGSLSEIIDDLNSHTEIEKKQFINKLLQPIFNKNIFRLEPNIFGFKNIKEKSIFNPFESQIDTGKMMGELLQKVLSQNIKILNNVIVETFLNENNSVKLKTNLFELSTSKLLIATNGFASQLLNETVEPARAQVLITKPIKNLHINGTFHLDKGYYYFRNINNRVLFGGGRNLDFKHENTSIFGETKLIQNKLEELLKTTILPETPFEIEHRWSGIMGIGSRLLSGQKKPIIKQIDNNVFCGVRLGGMGVAIGSLVGKQLANLV